MLITFINSLGWTLIKPKSNQLTAWFFIWHIYTISSPPLPPRTISPASASAYYVFIVHGDGNLGNYNALYRGSVRPSLYLKQDVKVVGGTGTSSDPYTLEI